MLHENEGILRMLRPEHTVASRRTFGFAFAALLCLCAIPALHAATMATAAAKPAAAPVQPDLLIFPNGDRLTGQFEKVQGGNIFFKSDTAGEVQVAPAKIRQLVAHEDFAIIEVGARIRRRHANPQVPRGTLVADAQAITMQTSNGTMVVLWKNVSVLIPTSAYVTDVEHSPNVLHGWKGAITAGASTVTSTQNEVTYNSAITLSRAIPMAAWLRPSYRTLLNFSNSYGKITQPNTPTVKTSIFHASAEQDHYFSPRFYALGQSIFDHNYAQGLDLQQMYGAGFGFTVLKSARQELDFSGTTNYTKQQFQVAASNLNLVGSTFSNTYTYKFPHGVLFNEAASITPEWNNMNAYSANASGGLTLPVFKKLAFSVQAIDSYLNNPPPGFQPNSLQLNTGLTYTLP